MMQKTLATVLGILIFGWAGPVSADPNTPQVVIAGWDFSQYFGDGLLSIDGSTFTDFLNANYSNLDPTFNLGTESADFGTMYINGMFGSTDVPAGTGNEKFFPTQQYGSLTPNLEAPVQGFGDQPFDKHNELASEGQQFTEFLSMTASETTDVVFEATLTQTPLSVPPMATDWVLTFAGRTFSGTSSVGVMYSTNGSSYVSAGSAGLGTTEGGFNVPLTIAPLSQIFVKLTLDSTSGQPYIDNVAIEAIVDPNAAGPCDEFGGDTDGDGICDDGDNSGTSGDNTCIGGATTNCDDNCKFIANGDQQDSAGVGIGPPPADGIGDLCQCGDVNGDGKVDGLDSIISSRVSVDLPVGSSFSIPGNCDMNGDGFCDGLDSILISRASVELPNPPSVTGRACPSYTNACVVDEKGNCLP